MSRGDRLHQNIQSCSERPGRDAVLVQSLGESRTQPQKAGGTDEEHDRISAAKNAAAIGGAGKIIQVEQARPLVGGMEIVQASAYPSAHPVAARRRICS